MSWTYSQSSGEMRDPDGALLETGYAGAPPWVNNPRAEPLEDRGPLPTGTYYLEAAVDHPNLGPVSIPLTPHADNEMHGRSEFFIHGDTATMDQTASKGCIILSRPSRETLDASPTRALVVSV